MGQRIKRSIAFVIPGVPPVSDLCDAQKYPADVSVCKSDVWGLCAAVLQAAGMKEGRADGASRGKREKGYEK